MREAVERCNERLRGLRGVLNMRMDRDNRVVLEFENGERFVVPDGYEIRAEMNEPLSFVREYGVDEVIRPTDMPMPTYQVAEQPDRLFRTGRMYAQGGFIEEHVRYPAFTIPPDTEARFNITEPPVVECSAKEQAFRRSVEYLRSVLTPVEQAYFDTRMPRRWKDRYDLASSDLMMKSEHGYVYRIFLYGLVYNVVRVDRHGCQRQNFCGHPSNAAPEGGVLPLGDAFVGQVLALRFNEDMFMEQANKGGNQRCRSTVRGALQADPDDYYLDPNDFDTYFAKAVHDREAFEAIRDQQR